MVEFHRNGISGEGFHVVRFSFTENGQDHPNMLGVVFPPSDEGATGPDGYTKFPTEFHNPHVAVFDADLLPEVSFGRNSWRGDYFAPALYAAIEEDERKS